MGNGPVFFALLLAYAVLLVHNQLSSMLLWPS
jgi:hypothetical protein